MRAKGASKNQFKYEKSDSFFAAWQMKDVNPRVYM